MNCTDFHLPLIQTIFRRSLRHIILVTCLLLLLCCSLLAWQSGQQFAANLQAQTNTLANNLSDSIVSGDLRARQNLLFNLAQHTRLRSITLYDQNGQAQQALKDGALISTDHRQIVDFAHRPALHFYRDQVVSVSTLNAASGPAGYVMVCVSTWPLYQHILMLLLAGLLLGLLFSGWLAYMISRQQWQLLQPVMAVASSVEQAAQLGDYSVRTQTDHARHFGHLATNINLLLARIEAWETDMHSDASQQRAIENRLHILDNHDSLTKLPNRHYFHRVLTHNLEDALAKQETLALIFIDLDHFRQISTRAGYDVCDQILVQVAQRYTDVLRSTDTLCRVGADEFAIVLPQAEGLKIIQELALRLLHTLDDSCHVDGHDYQVSASIGIACCPWHAHEQRLLLRNADLALQAAKAAGRNTWRLYQESGATEPGLPA